MAPDAAEAGGELDAAEVLLRRYSPTNPSHVLHDQATGERFLNYAGLRFDVDGCSVYREPVLAADGRDRSAIVVDDVHIGIAESSVGAVRTFVHEHQDGTVAPFDVVAAPLESRPPEPADPAHALITKRPAAGLSNRQWDKACVRLARQAFTL